MERGLKGSYHVSFFFAGKKCMREKKKKIHLTTRLWLKTTNWIIHNRAGERNSSTGRHLQVPRYVLVLRIFSNQLVVSLRDPYLSRPKHFAQPKVLLRSQKNKELQFTFGRKAKFKPYAINQTLGNCTFAMEGGGVNHSAFSLLQFLFPSSSFPDAFLHA